MIAYLVMGSGPSDDIPLRLIVGADMHRERLAGEAVAEATRTNFADLQRVNGELWGRDGPGWGVNVRIVSFDDKGRPVCSEVIKEFEDDTFEGFQDVEPAPADPGPGAGI